MPTVVLDCNVFDRLADDGAGRAHVQHLVQRGDLVVLMPATLREELEQGPFRGVPDWFPCRAVPDSVFVVGHSRLGEARLGDGRIYTAHRGTSRQIPDAVLADIAELEADYFVSEDNRARRRLAQIAARCSPLTYAEFRADVLQLAP